MIIQHYKKARKHLYSVINGDAPAILCDTLPLALLVARHLCGDPLSGSEKEQVAAALAAVE